MKSNLPPLILPPSKRKYLYIFSICGQILIKIFLFRYHRVETTAVPTVAAPTVAAPTAAAPNRKVPNRKGRAAIESEFSLSPDFSEDYPENQAHDIQSAFYSGPFDPVALPFFRRYTEPDVSQHRQSSFFDLLGSLFRSRTTFTVFEIKTSTLTPTCSVAGPLPQCPNL